MARIKQTKLQTPGQPRASSTPATPPLVLASEGTINGHNEQAPDTGRVDAFVRDPTAVWDPEEIVASTAVNDDDAARRTTLAPPAKRKSRTGKDDRLPYLPAHELKGFIRQMPLEVRQFDPPKSLQYCLDCLRTHMIIWCDGTHEEVEATCAFHEKKNNGRLNVQYYNRIREMLASDFSRRGVFHSRRFTKPSLQHRQSCEHDNKDSMKYWDDRVVEDLEVVKAAEEKHAQAQKGE